MVLLHAIASASAGVHVGVGAGLEAVVNDPFRTTKGGRVEIALALREPIELGIVLAGYPPFDDGPCGGGWTVQACELSVHVGLGAWPRMGWQTQATVRILPFRTSLADGWRTAMGVAAGVGLVGTTDPLGAIGADSEAPRVLTHPSAVGGWLGEIRNEHFGFRLHTEAVSYVEVTYGYNLDTTHAFFAGAEGMAWF